MTQLFNVFSRRSFVKLAATCVLVLIAAPRLAFAASLPPLKQATLTMQAGQRLSYLQASATVGRSGLNLIPDANGNWVSVSTNQILPEGAGSGGAGVSVIDICEKTNTSIVADQTTYLLNTVTNSITLASHNTLKGDGQTLAEIWARPQNFAQVPDQNKKDLRVKRITYTLDGRKFAAVRIQVNTGNGWTQSTYDLATGLLIIKSYAVQIPGGGTGLAFMRITSGKLLQNQPGINTSWPSAIKKFTTYNWLAKGSGGVFNSGSVSGQAAMSYTSMNWSSKLLTCNVKVNGKSNGSLQQVAGRIGSVWMDPNFLKKVAKNQVIDSESALQYQIVVSSVDSSSVTFKFSNKNQSVSYKYNKSTGDMIGFSTTSQEGLFGSAASVAFVSRK